MAKTTYDELEVKIVAKTDVAISNIDRFSSRLEKLEQLAQKLDFSRLGKVQKILQDIANVDFTSVANGLQSVVKSFESLNNAGNNVLTSSMQQVEDTFSESAEQIEEKLANVSKAIELSGKDAIQFADKMGIYGNAISNYGTKNLADFEEHLSKVSQGLAVSSKQVQEADARFEKLGQSLINIGLNGTQAEDVIKTIGLETNKFSPEQLKQVEKLMTQLGYSAEQVKMTLSKLAKESDKTTKKMSSGLGKIAIKFKSLALYRVLRLALMQIQKSLQGGIEGLAKSDNGFNQAISTLSNSFSYLANTLVSTIAPLLETIAPVIDMLVDGLVEILNLLGELFSSLTGKSTFTMAVKSSEDYADNLERAKAAMLGIDELNVVKQDSQSQFTQQETTIDTNSGLSEIFSSIKNFFSDLIPKFIDGIQPIIVAIGRVFDAIAPIVDVILEIAGEFADDTMDGVNEMITSFVNMIADVLKYVKKILDAFSPIISFIESIFSFLVNGLNNSIQFIFETISSTLPLIEPIITAIQLILGTVFAEDGIVGRIFSAFQTFGTAFGELFTGDGTFAQILTVVNQILGAVGNELVKGAAGGLGIGYYNLPKWEQVLLGVLTLGTAPLFGLIGKHADGGFVEDGLFYANHNELVGTFSNGRTAVANNEQITEGIYLAVLQAMRESNNGGNISIQIDGREIAKVVEKYNKQNGNAGFVGGYYNG